MATIRSSSVSRALQTVPNAPMPICSISFAEPARSVCRQERASLARIEHDARPARRADNFGRLIAHDLNRVVAVRAIDVQGPNSGLWQLITRGRYDGAVRRERVEHGLAIRARFHVALDFRLGHGIELAIDESLKNLVRWVLVHGGVPPEGLGRLRSCRSILMTRFFAT